MSAADLKSTLTAKASLVILIGFAGLLGQQHSTAQAGWFEGREPSIAWEDDLQFLEQQLLYRADEIFDIYSKESFVEDMHSLRRQAAELPDVAVVLKLREILARFRDAHTDLSLWTGTPRALKAVFPLELAAVEDGWVVVGAEKSLKDLVGTQLLRVNHHDIKEIYKSLRPYVSAENGQVSRSEFGDLAMLQDALRFIGVIGEDGGVQFEFLSDSGVIQRAITPAVNEDAVDWSTELVKPSRALWTTSREVDLWFTRSVGDRSIFVQFNSADISRGAEQQKFEAKVSKLADEIEKFKPESIVLDIRWNHGGSSIRTRSLFQLLAGYDQRCEEPCLAVLIGPGTYSAAVMHAAWLEQHTDAVFIGSATGGSPGRIGEIRRIWLPSSGYRILYSAVFHSPASPRDRRPALLPDISAPTFASDFVSGRDPALRAAKNLSQAVPLGDVLIADIASKDAQDLLHQYDDVVSSSTGKYVENREQLRNVASHLLKIGRLDDAVAVLRRNIEVYPYHAETHFNLAQVLKEGGELREAAASYCRAFKMDPRLDDGIDLVFRLKPDCLE